VLVAVVAAACAPAAAPGTAPIPAALRTEPRVVVYGDSLTWEARRYIPAIAAQLHMQVSVYSFVGTAICDWFADMWRRLPAERPAVVVDAFYGNSWTKCMQDGHGVALAGAATAARYNRDAHAAAAIAMASGANVVFVGAPRTQREMSDPGWQRVRDQFRAVAAEHPGRVTFRDSGVNIAPDGRFAATVPCLPRERTLTDSSGVHACQNGRIIVRAPDGLHFCPHGLDNKLGQPGNCPVYMSGAYRYAVAIVAAAHAATESSRPTDGVRVADANRGRIVRSAPGMIGRGL
jgi:hypothetical protein